MIYQWVELQKTMLTPAAQLAKVTNRLLVHPRNPLAKTLVGRTLAASAEVVDRTLHRYPKPAFCIDQLTIEGHSVQFQQEVVQQRPFCVLQHFRRLPSAAASPTEKLLIVAPLSGHFATLLRDTVRTALPDFDVYITDWADAKSVPLRMGAFHLDDYIHYVMDFLRYLGPQTHVMAVCQPTVPVLAAASLLAQQNDPCVPRSLVLMGGPVDARKSPTEVNRFAVSKSYKWFEDNLIMRVPLNYPGFLRRVYPGFLQHASFLLMNPKRHLKAHLDFYYDLLRGDAKSAEAHRKFYDEYHAVLDMAAEYYLDTIRAVFQDYLLARGLLTVSGQRVQPEALVATRLMTVEGELDDIAGLGQTEAAQRLCSGLGSSQRQHLVAPGAGHYGIFSGHRFREQVYPRIRAFLQQQ